MRWLRLGTYSPSFCLSFSMIFVAQSKTTYLTVMPVKSPRIMKATSRMPSGSAQSRGADREAPSQSLSLFCAAQSLPWCADQQLCLLLQSLHDLAQFEAPSLPRHAAGSGRFACLLGVGKGCSGVFWRHIAGQASQARSAIQYRW